MTPLRAFVTCILALSGIAPAQGAPPRVAGVTLGSTATEVSRRVGRPDREAESLGMRFWDYDVRGLTLIWFGDEPQLQGLVLRRASAGAIDGVLVGDDLAVLARVWGTPSRVRQEGRFHDFVRAEWVVSAEVVDGRIATLTLLRARPPDR